MGMPGGPTVLPFKAEKLSFSLAYKSDEAPDARIELACVCFDRDCQVLDYIQFSRKAALNSSLKHSSCTYLAQHDALPADEAIYLYPFDFSPQCEVMLLVASAPKSPLHRNDLGCSKKLQFKVHARESGQELQMLDVDLGLFVAQPANAGSVPLSNGHQTMVIAGVYTTPQGWTLSFDCTTFPEDSWGLLLPQLRSLLQRWPSLSAASAAARQPPQTVICSRKGQDEPIQELTSRLFPPAAVAVAAATVSNAETAEGSSQEGAAASQDGLQAVPPAGVVAGPAPAEAAVPANVEKLVLELGWEVFKPRATEEEEEEPPVVDFALTVYNLQGEELATISPDNPEAEGIIVDEEEPDVPEEQPAAEAEADGAADSQQEPAGDGDGEGGEGDDEDGEVERIDLDEDEETKAAKASAAAEASAAEAQRAAANQRPLQERFPLKRKVHLTFSELPPGSRALMLTLSQFGGNGFKNVKSLHARVVLEDEQQKKQQQDTADADAEEDGEEEKPKKKLPKLPARVLMHYRFDSVQGADAHLSQILMFKLYKEYPDSAFAIWQQQQVPDVAALLGGSSAADIAASSSEKAKEVLQSVLAKRKQLEKELEDLRKKNAEEGIDEDEEGEPDLRLGKGIWRVRVLGHAAGGEGPEALTDLVNSLLAYDGDLDAAGLRSCRAAKVAFPNRDTYFGAYEADAKAGTGLYVFANGGAYIGQYQGGKRQGQGLMILPDGGMYRGQFAADKFEGLGTYLYPDKSSYIGDWKAGKKHGQGTYWDTAGGCLRGEWAAGALKGEGQYDQPNYHFNGTFAKGVPAGPCTFTISAFRAVDLPQPAASYVIAPYGPTLCGEGRYAVPPGTDDEPEPTGEEDAEPPEEDPDKPGLPQYPKYEGLSYESASSLPCSQPDVIFPPPNTAVAAV